MSHSRWCAELHGVKHSLATTPSLPLHETLIGLPSATLQVLRLELIDGVTNLSLDNILPVPQPNHGWLLLSASRCQHPGMGALGQPPSEERL